MKDHEWRWEMPDSTRNFNVEVDDDGGVFLSIGSAWTARTIGGLSVDEFAWLASCAGEIVEYAREQAS